MNYKRIIPCLDVDGGRVVKGVRFVDIRDAGDPIELAAHYDRAGADEVVFLDITATHEKRDTIAQLARRTADEVFVPFTIGGGIRSAADAQGVLDAGADKVSVNSAALARPQLIDELANVFGSQCVVLAIDARARRGEEAAQAGEGWDAYVAGGRTASGHDALRWAREGVERGAGEILLTSMDRDGTSDGYEVVVNGGRTPTGIEAVGWARQGVERGAGEILLTSMDRDGTEHGYELELTRRVSDAVDVPVIASGGAGTLDHMVEAIEEGGADAVLAASIFHYGVFSVGEAKERLRSAGIPVR